MIKVKHIPESVAVLYGPKDKLIGIITSAVQLNDIRIQIRKEQVSGYYMLWNNENTGTLNQIFIDKDGRLDGWPKGFFDVFDEQLTELL